MLAGLCNATLIVHIAWKMGKKAREEKLELSTKSKEIGLSHYFGLVNTLFSPLIHSACSRENDRERAFISTLPLLLMFV